MMKKVYKYALIIFALEILSLIYNIFSIDIKFFNAIIEVLNDASTFITVICVLFIIVSFFMVPKEYGLIIWSSVDIILAQRLYSNDKLKNILIWIKGLDIVQIIFYLVFIAVISAILFIIYKYRPKNPIRGNSQDPGLPGIIDWLPPNETGDGGDSGDVPVTGPEDGGGSGEKPKTGPEEKRRKPSFTEIVFKIIIFICFLIMFDFFIYNFFITRNFVNVNVPKWLNNTYLFLSAITALSIIISLFAAKIIFKLFRSGGMITEKPFRFSALVALISEIAIIIFANKINAIEFTDFFLSAITENWFSAIFAVVFLFLILQIACTIFIHFFGGENNNEEDKIVRNLKEHIIEIENNIVEIACGIVEGCINLFDFMPDFFKTIGIVLLDREDKKGSRNCGDNENNPQENNPQENNSQESNPQENNSKESNPQENNPKENNPQA